MNELARRLRAEWRLKVFGGGAILLAYWAGYFLLEHHPAAAVTSMPEIMSESKIPFVPGAAWIYVSQFAGVPLIICLPITRQQLYRYFRGLGILIGTSFACFYFWPTSVGRPPLPPAVNFIYALVASADLPRNACPSLHAGFGLFTALCATELFRGVRGGRWLAGLVWLWTAAVLFSTLLIKQHVILDLLAGGGLGALSWRLMGTAPDKRLNPA